MRNKSQDLVIIITVCTEARWLGGTYLQVGDELPNQGPVPRWFAEAYVKACSPGFKARIVEVDR